MIADLFFSVCFIIDFYYVRLFTLHSWIMRQWKLAMCNNNETKKKEKKTVEPPPTHLLARSFARPFTTAKCTKIISNENEYDGFASSRQHTLLMNRVVADDAWNMNMNMNNDLCEQRQLRNAYHFYSFDPVYFTSFHHILFIQCVCVARGSLFSISSYCVKEKKLHSWCEKHTQFCTQSDSRH